MRFYAISIIIFYVAMSHLLLLNMALKNKLFKKYYHVAWFAYGFVVFLVFHLIIFLTLSGKTIRL